MKKINRRIPSVRFVKSSGSSRTSSGGRIIKNSAIKKSNPSIQSEKYAGPLRKHNPKAMKMVNHFSKTAATSADIHQSIPTFYHPDFEPSSLILPKDRIEINSWCNYFYKYDALVSTAVDLHSELPLSKIRLDLPHSIDKKRANRILEHYVDMIGTTGIDLFNKLLMFGVEYYKVGNVFPWAQMSADGTKWERLTCLDPNYVRLEKLGLTDSLNVSLIPDDKLRRIVHAGPYDEKTGMLYQTLSEEVIENVMLGKEIPLSTDPSEGSHVSHLARKLADYADWGTSIIERNFKTLVYKDRLRQSQDAIATRHLTPKHLIWADLASKADVNEIRDQVEDAMLNPDSAIITNYELHWELIGTSSGLMQLSTERDWITEDLLVGLMMSKNILLGEGKFAAGQTVLEIMNQRYAIFREVLEAYIEKNLFLPIARNMGLVEYQPGTVKKNPREVFLYPRVRWNRLNLTDDTQHKQMLAQAVAEGKVDTATWLEYFGLNADTIAERLKANEDTVLDPAYNELRRSIMMEVGRSLGPAVAKVYADAYGIEIDDPMGGGMGMFASSKAPITKFGKEFDIQYGENGELIIKPQIEIETHDIKSKHATQIKKEFVEKTSSQPVHVTAESREERKHDRDTKKSKKKVEQGKKKYEVVDIDRKNLKPSRKDLQKTVPNDLFKASKIIARQFDKEAEEVEEESNSITPTSMNTASELSIGYDDMPLQDPERTAETKQRIDKISVDQSRVFQKLREAGINENTRKLAKNTENEISSIFYRLANGGMKTSTLKSLLNKRVHQVYAGVYHSLAANSKETMYQSSQSVKGIFDADMTKRSSALTKKLELIADANKKIAKKYKGNKIRVAFQKNEDSVREAFRGVVDNAIEDIQGLLS